MPPDQPQFGLGKTTPREMASIMERLAACNLALDGSRRRTPRRAATAPSAARCSTCCTTSRTATACPAIIESLDTSEHGSAIANKTGALDQVRNDVALISTKAGPVVIAAFTFENADQRWNGDNEGEITLARVAQAVVKQWSPEGLDAQAFPWDNPLKSSCRIDHGP